jgi:hypothetical protein
VGPEPASGEDARRAAAGAQRERGYWGLLVLAVAALASSWNPVAAPFGLVVGIATAILSVRALRRSRVRRRIPASALAGGVLAAVASAMVLGFTAGSLGIELPGEPVVKGRTPAELEQVLSEAAERTRARREGATQELDALRGGPARAPARGAKDAPPGGAGAHREP